APRAAGGVSIIALLSTGREGAVSRIVPHLASGAAVTTPRFLADYVVTEQGAAQLRGLSDRARGAPTGVGGAAPPPRGRAGGGGGARAGPRAWGAVAHPRYQGELERALRTS